MSLVKKSLSFSLGIREIFLPGIVWKLAKQVQKAQIQIEAGVGGKRQIEIPGILMGIQNTEFVRRDANTNPSVH